MTIPPHRSADTTFTVPFVLDFVLCRDPVSSALAFTDNFLASISAPPKPLAGGAPHPRPLDAVLACQASARPSLVNSRHFACRF